MNMKKMMESEGYKILFPWTKAEYCDEEDVNFITAANPIAFFEIKWNGDHSGPFQCYVNGEKFDSVETLALAMAYCVGVFRGEVMKGFAYMLSLGVELGPNFKAGAWSTDSLRAFAIDQARQDILSPENISKLLAFVKESDYTENMEDEPATEIKAQTKPTLH